MVMKERQSNSEAQWCVLIVFFQQRGRRYVDIFIQYTHSVGFVRDFLKKNWTTRPIKWNRVCLWPLASLHLSLSCKQFNWRGNFSSKPPEHLKLSCISQEKERKKQKTRVAEYYLSSFLTALIILKPHAEVDSCILVEATSEILFFYLSKKANNCCYNERYRLESIYSIIV